MHNIIEAEIERVRSIHIVERTEAHACQSPLNCGNTSATWHNEQSLYLCDHCREVLQDIKNGVTGMFG